MIEQLEKISNKTFNIQDFRKINNTKEKKKDQEEEFSFFSKLPSSSYSKSTSGRMVAKILGLKLKNKNEDFRKIFSKKKTALKQQYLPS